MWKISVDTGGTFTDCIALSPDDKTKRLKVLSDGSIRGRFLQKKNGRFLSDLKYRLSKDIFKGYTVFIEGHSESLKVMDFDANDNSFTIDLDITFDQAMSFHLTANEEAPILATRIITETALNDNFPPIDFRLGTTKGTNALLEKKGGKTLLLITKGFKDLLFIGTQQRPHLFQLNIPNPHLLYTDIIEVNERISSEGNVLIHLNKKEIYKIIDKLKNNAYDSVAVALLNSYKNNKHELILEKILLENNIINLSVSSKLHPFIHLLPRARTTLINAYLQPVLNH